MTSPTQLPYLSERLELEDNTERDNTLIGLSVVTGVVLLVGGIGWGWRCALAGLGLIILPIAKVTVQGYLTRRRNGELLRMVHAGETERAIAEYARLIARARSRSNHMILLNNLSVAYNKQGRHRRALAVVSYAEQLPGASNARPMTRQLLAHTAAWNFALLGLIPYAKAWCEELGRRGGERLLSMVLTLPLISLREERPQQALAELEEIVSRWPDDSDDTAYAMATALRVFALSELKTPWSEYEKPLANLRTFPKHHYEHFAVDWPEFQAFLEREQLS
jgi:tetratricopeptide (TPR) repeat protein